MMHQGQLVAQYRQHLDMTQEALADEMGIHLRTVQRLESKAMIRSIARRWFLVGLLGIPASELGLEGSPPWSKKRYLIVNDDTMGFFEHELAMRWQVYKASGPALASQGLASWMTQVQGFAQECSGTPWQKRSLAVLSMSFQLEGSILRDTTAYPQAHESLQNALHAAQEAGSRELIGSSMLRRGTIFIRQENPVEAIAYFNGALEKVKDSPFPNLRGNTLQACAEAYAMAQRSQECWTSLGLAEHIFGREEQSHEQAYVSFNAPKATAWKGVYALLLNDHERAINLLEKGLAEYNPTRTPTRARFLARKAEAYYGAHQIGECISTAQEALTLAVLTGEKSALERVRKLHAKLITSRWRTETGLKSLGASLAASTAS
jgi:transcriptional regulator with XRE-family HTH domain/tetratricopeptide (TPR) repeat protein